MFTNFTNLHIWPGIAAKRSRRQQNLSIKAATNVPATTLIDEHVPQISFASFFEPHEFLLGSKKQKRRKFASVDSFWNGPEKKWRVKRVKTSDGPEF